MPNFLHVHCRALYLYINKFEVKTFAPNLYQLHDFLHNHQGIENNINVIDWMPELLLKLESVFKNGKQYEQHPQLGKILSGLFLDTWSKVFSQNPEKVLTLFLLELVSVTEISGWFLVNEYIKRILIIDKSLSEKIEKTLTINNIVGLHSLFNKLKKMLEQTKEVTPLMEDLEIFVNDFKFHENIESRFVDSLGAVIKIYVDPGLRTAIEIRPLLKAIRVWLCDAVENKAEIVKAVKNCRDSGGDITLLMIEIKSEKIVLGEGFVYDELEMLFEDFEDFKSSSRSASTSSQSTPLVSPKSESVSGSDERLDDEASDDGDQVFDDELELSDDELSDDESQQDNRNKKITHQPCLFRRHSIHNMEEYRKKIEEDSDNKKRPTLIRRYTL